MDFDPDLFISYARIDNQSVNLEHDGWVSVFHKALEIRLSQLRGERPKIWRDLKMQGNDYLDDTIFRAVSNTALLISILSPRYVKSEWCMRELKSFCEVATSTDGLRVGNSKARLFKVIKTHLPLEQQPLEFESLIGYDFFEFDEAGRTQEFDKVYSSELGQKFYSKLNDLACDIHNTLEILEATSVKESQDSSPSKIEKMTIGEESAKTLIYLAETTYDLHDARDKIHRELTMAGYQVLPTQPLPLTPDFSQRVQENLIQCSMSIHLVSPRGNALQSTESASSKALDQLFVARSQEQIEISEKCFQGRETASRILWISPAAQISEKDEFLQLLQGKPDFLSTSLEALKTTIYDRIAQISYIPNAPIQNSLRKIYLDCDQRDLDTDDIEPLYDWLEERFHVVLPDYSTSSLSQSEASLRQCEAVLIYYGQASGLWLKRRLLALRKTIYDRPKPLLAKAVYLARPDTPVKQTFSDSDVIVIDGLKQFNPGLLKPFLSELEEI